MVDMMAALGRMKRKAGYHHGDLEEALVQTVQALIERDGVGDFSIAEACKSLGVSTAAPYKHFADKQDILSHVAKSGFEDMTRQMEAARDQHPLGSTGRIGAIGKTYVDFALANPETFKLMFGSTPDVKGNDAVKSVGHACFDVLISEVASFIGSTNEAADSLQVSVMLWTFVHGAASLAIDKDYEVARMDVDLHALIEAAGSRMLGHRG